MIMNNIELVNYVKGVYARSVDTVYILSGIGRKLSRAKVDERYARGEFNSTRRDLLYKEVGKFAYDCVGLIKSFLWSGNVPYGGITYNVPGGSDQNVRMMWNAAKERGEVSNEMHPDVPGLLVMTNDLGHVGVYIGVENGKRTYIECTVTDGAWKVIKSYGYKGKGHTWARWAKYALIDYVAAPKPPVTPPAKKTNEQIAAEVKLGRWGNGKDRVNRLTAAGYDAKAIQAIVDASKNKPVAPTPTPPKPAPSRTVGSSVVVNGQLYTNSAAKARGKTVHKNVRATIDKVVPGAKAPFHVKGSGISGWASEVEFGGATTEAPKFKPYSKWLDAGTVLYQANGARYPKPISGGRSVTILEENNGMGRFEGDLIGTKDAWVKL